MKRYLQWGLLLVLPCYLLDQLSKWYICRTLAVGDGFTVIPDFFRIFHVRNTGAAFGILQGMPETWRTVFFTLVTLVACVAILWIFRDACEDSRFARVVLCLVFAGALGNLTDRLLIHEVVDFLDFRIFSYPWPTFNVADTYISVGMVGLVGYTLRSSRRDRSD